MFSSFSSFSLPLPLPRFLAGYTQLGIDLTPVQVYHIETQKDKRSRSLKHLLKLNHVNHSIVYHDLHFHNHMPHILGSAYMLGANAEHLNAIYEEESKELEKWVDSPTEVSQHDWRDYLGDGRYQRAYVDFFEDQLVLNAYDWRKVLDKYMFAGKEPLINCLIAGRQDTSICSNIDVADQLLVGHPLIHLGYAFELSSRDLAMEALGLATTSYNFLHKYLDEAAYTRPSANSSTDLLDILANIVHDERLDGVFDHPGADNIKTLFIRHEDVVIEHWNSWKITNVKKQFEDSQKTAAALFAATQGRNRQSFDFFLVHVLTTSHAVRILLSVIPVVFHIPLVRQWWLLTISVYIAQLRPAVQIETVSRYELAGRNWEWVDRQAIEGQWSTDAHYVKALRALKVAAATWIDPNLFYLKAALKFADNFMGWGGFGLTAEGN